MSVEESQETSYGRFLEFSLGKEKFAIPLLQVRELISIPETTPIPNAPKHFLGIMNLRGQVISVVDLRKKLKFSVEESTKEEAVIIIEIDDINMGVVVDSINKVVNVEEGAVQDIPEIESQLNAEYINGIFKYDDNLVILMNLKQILSLSDIKNIRKSAA